jgi:hypothetical protein
VTAAQEKFTLWSGPTTSEGEVCVQPGPLTDCTENPESTGLGVGVGGAGVGTIVGSNVGVGTGVNVASGVGVGGTGVGVGVDGTDVGTDVGVGSSVGVGTTVGSGVGEGAAVGAGVDVGSTVAVGSAVGTASVCADAPEDVGELASRTINATKTVMTMARPCGWCWLGEVIRSLFRRMARGPSHVLTSCSCVGSTSSQETGRAIRVHNCRSSHSNEFYVLRCYQR